MSKGLKIVVIAAGVGVVALLLFPPIPGCGPPPPSSLIHVHCQGDISQLMTACKMYHTEYGTNPTGDLATLAAILKGDNPRHVVFIELPSNKTNKRGEFIDPWGTPFEISFDSTNGYVRVRSAGPNKRFGDVDDLTSW